MKKTYIVIIFLFFCHSHFNAQCPFTGPDTVCVNQAVVLQNYSDSATGPCGISGSKTHQWFYESSTLDTLPYVKPVNTSIMKDALFIGTAKDSGKYYTFVTTVSQGQGPAGARLYRQNYGNNPANTPTNTLLYTNAGYTFFWGIKIVQDSGIWYAFIIADYAGPFSPFKKPYDVMRLRFNNGIEDPNPTVSFLKIPDSLFSRPQPIDIVNVGSHWYGIVGNNGWIGIPTDSSIIVMDFTKGLNAAPSTIVSKNYFFTDTAWHHLIPFDDSVKNVIDGPTSIVTIEQNGKWHTLCSNQWAKTLLRIDFEDGFTNPKFTDIGSINNTIDSVYGFTLFNDCSTLMGIAVNQRRNSLTMLYFDSTITGTVTGVEYNMDTSLVQPHAITEIMHYGGTAFAYILNYGGIYGSGTLSLLKFSHSGKSQINLTGPVPDTNFNPDPTLYYKKPGRYNISLVIGGNPSTTTCHTIYVMNRPGAVLAILPTEACPGTPIKAIVPDTINAYKVRYEWTYPKGQKSYTREPLLTDSGTYTVKLSYDQCVATKTYSAKIDTTDYPSAPIINQMPTNCPGLSTQIYISGLRTGDEVKWYTDSLMTHLVHDTTTNGAVSYYINNALTSGIYPYYVIRKPINKGTCLYNESNPLYIALRLFKPKAPAISGGGKKYCLGDSITYLTAAPVMQGIRWFNDSLLVNQIKKGIYYNPTPDIKTGGIYSFYATYDSTATCHSDPGKAIITVTEIPQPVCPDLIECENYISPSSKFTATGMKDSIITFYGDSLKISIKQNGKSPLNYYHGETTKGVYPYWVTQKAKGCESLMEKVTLTINKTEKPVPYMYDTNYYTCWIDNVNPLRVKADSGYSKVEWYEGTNVVGSATVFTPAIDVNKIASYSYKVRQQVNNCWSLYAFINLYVVKCKDTSLSFCSTMASYNLFTSQPIPVRNYFWQDNDSTTSLKDSIIDLSNPGIFGKKTFQYFIYRVKTNVDKQLYAGNPKDTTFSSCIGNIDLTTLLRNRDNGGIWYKNDSTINSPAVRLKPGSNLYKYYIPVSPNGTCKEDLSNISIKADSTPPVIISCINKELKPLEAGQTEFTVEENKYDPFINDECSAYKVTYTVNGQSNGDTTLVGEKLPIGINQIAWTVTDSLGQKSNTCYCEFTVAYFIIPNYFTPNGDGYNDTWYFSLEKTPGATVKIYNQWGIMVYDSKGKTLIDWDGRNTKGLECPADGYQYLITIGEKMLYKGSFTIIR